MMKVKVKIALAVDADGGWNSAGWIRMDEEDAQNMALEGCKDEFPAVYWLEAEVDTPEPPKVVTATAMVTKVAV